MTVFIAVPVEASLQNRHKVQNFWFNLLTIVAAGFKIR